MTDPAPPARTTLKRDADRAFFVEHIRTLAADGYVPEAVAAIAALETQAFNEGRLAGLLDACGVLERMPAGLSELQSTVLIGLIGGLAEDAPKAPTSQDLTHSDPDPR